MASAEYNDDNGAAETGAAETGAAETGAAETGAAASVSNGSANGRQDALVPVEYQNGAMAEMGWPMGYPVKPEILNAAPTLTTMWNAFNRRWPLALGLGILLSVAGMLLTMLLVPIQYTAVARLRVSPEQNIIDNPRVSRRPIDEPYRETQQALIKSQFVLIEALRKSDISQLEMIKEQGDDKIAWLQDNLRAKYTSPESEILDLKIEYRDKKQAVLLLNAVLEAYLNESVDGERAKVL